MLAPVSKLVRAGHPACLAQVDPVYQEMSVAEKLNLFENGQCPEPSVCSPAWLAEQQCKMRMPSDRMLAGLCPSDL